MKSLSRTKEPIESYKLLKFFLILWKCLEHAKYAWGKRKLFVEEIDKPSLFKEYRSVLLVMGGGRGGGQVHDVPCNPERERERDLWTLGQNILWR